MEAQRVAAEGDDEPAAEHEGGAPLGQVPRVPQRHQLEGLAEDRAVQDAEDQAQRVLGELLRGGAFAEEEALHQAVEGDGDDVVERGRGHHQGVDALVGAEPLRAQLHEARHHHGRRDGAQDQPEEDAPQGRQVEEEVPQADDGDDLHEGGHDGQPQDHQGQRTQLARVQPQPRAHHDQRERGLPQGRNEVVILRPEVQEGRVFEGHADDEHPHQGRHVGQGVHHPAGQRGAHEHGHEAEQGSVDVGQVAEEAVGQRP